MASSADLIDQALATAMHYMRVNVTSTLNVSPGSLVLGRDMFLDIPLISDWQIIHQKVKR